MVSFLVAALGWEPAPPQDLRLLKAPVHGRRETGERGGGGAAIRTSPGPEAMPTHSRGDPTDRASPLQATSWWLSRR